MKPLDTRIAAALGANARAATVSALIDEVEAALQACQAEHDNLDALSKSATATEDEADEAADKVFKLSRKLVRLAAKRDQLQTRHDALMTSERRQRAVAEHEAVMTQRDQLVEDLKRDMPRLLAEMVDLLRRIEESDAECEGINRSAGSSYGLPHLASAEALARGCSGTYYHGGAPVKRLTKIQLPNFDASKPRSDLWPPDRRGPILQKIAEDERRERLAVKARRAAEDARWKACIVTPPADCRNSIAISTYRGEERILREPKQVKMTDEAIADAEAKGCAVKLVVARKSIDSPASSVGVF